MRIKRHRQTETTIETHEVWVLKRPLPKSLQACHECLGIPMLSPEEAANQLSINPRTIYRIVETGQVHFTELNNGWLLVCLESLSRLYSICPSLMEERLDPK